VAGSSECGHEPLGSMKCGEFLGSLREASQEELCSMELVS
jgi:hypothetical protein